MTPIGHPLVSSTSSTRGTMSTSRRFLQNLSASGLMTEKEIEGFLSRLGGNAPVDSAESLARELVQSGRLTSFQANAVHQGRVKGLVFGEYVILDKIGAGGMGRVFKARHRRMDRDVALKVLPKEALSSQEAVDRFHREVRTAARLSHPNIVTAYDAGEHHGMHYLVMEYVDGTDLAHVLRDKGPLSVLEAVDVLMQVARGLAYAHSRGIIHRDIKPSNLLRGADGTIKILDLGLARADAGPARGRTVTAPGTVASDMTEAGQIMGTIDYLAPEQAEDVRRADHRADIYSLGCTFFRLLSGRIPYPGTSSLKRLLAHREHPIPSLRQYRDDVPPALEEVFRKMVAKRPEERYASMDALLEDLTRMLPSLEAQVALCRIESRETPQGDAVRSFLKDLESGAQEFPPEDSDVSFPRLPLEDSTSVAHCALNQAKPVRQHSWKGRWRFAALVSLAAALMVPFIVVLASWRKSARLELVWPERERVDALLEIDGERHVVPQAGAIVIPLPPGQHRVVILRRGFHPVLWEVQLDSGKILSLRPRFHRAEIRADQ